MRNSAPNEALTDALLQYIDCNYHRGIAPRDVAAALHYSPFHLAHLAKRAVGSSVGALLVRRRIQAAADLLTQTSVPVSRIAWRVGFSSAGYFSRKFTQMMGMSPSRYRSAARTGTLL